MGPARLADLERVEKAARDFIAARENRFHGTDYPTLHERQALAALARIVAEVAEAEQVV